MGACNAWHERTQRGWSSSTHPSVLGRCVWRRRCLASLGTAALQTALSGCVAHAAGGGSLARLTERADTRGANKDRQGQCTVSSSQREDHSGTMGVEPQRRACGSTEVCLLLDCSRCADYWNCRQIVVTTLTLLHLATMAAVPQAAGAPPADRDAYLMQKFQAIAQRYEISDYFCRKLRQLEGFEIVLIWCV